MAEENVSGVGVEQEQNIPADIPEEDASETEMQECGTAEIASEPTGDVANEFGLPITAENFGQAMDKLQLWDAQIPRVSDKLGVSEHLGQDITLQRVTGVIDAFTELMRQNIREMPPGSVLAWKKLLIYTGSCFRQGAAGRSRAQQGVAGRAWQWEMFIEAAQGTPGTPDVNKELTQFSERKGIMRPQKQTDNKKTNQGPSKMRTQQPV
eukprot:Skav211941  [mRNA]  locus=scaffold1086:689145:695039:- [translate_table: standard]